MTDDELLNEAVDLLARHVEMAPRAAPGSLRADLTDMTRGWLALYEQVHGEVPVRDSRALRHRTPESVVRDPYNRLGGELPAVEYRRPGEGDAHLDDVGD